VNKNLIVTANFHFRRGSNRQKKVCRGKRPTSTPTGSVQRVSRLMSLAIQMQELVDTQQVSDYAELARLAHVSRARMTQVMNLNLLASSIQEEILHLPLSNGGRDPVREHMVRPITAIMDWSEQRKIWKELKERVNT